MAVRRAAPGSQVLPDFEVISCPQRGSLCGSGQVGFLLGRRRKKISVRMSLEQRLCSDERFCCFPEILDSKRKISGSLSQKRSR